METPRGQVIPERAEKPGSPSEAELEAALNRGAADIAAGRLLPLKPVLNEMRGVAQRLRRQRAAAGRALSTDALNS